MLRVVYGVLFMIFFISCGENKPSLSGDTPVNAKDFFNSFIKLNTPFVVADSNNHSIEDTTVLSYSVLTQFVPDTILAKLIGENNDNYYEIKPIGKIEKQNEIYLLINFNHNKKTTLVTFLFDKKYRFIAALELFNNKKNDGYKHSVSITNEPTFLLSREKTTDNHYYYTKNGYAFNKDANGFILVVNDSNEDADKADDIVNPIDTLPRKNKFSGDYAQDKKNFISIRDGKNSGDYIFFVHFEKDGGQCDGELKGEMKTVATDKTIYQQPDDPCVIDFSFESKSVYIKEEGSCGNHRGIKCYFDDTYGKVSSLKKTKKTQQTD